MLPWFIYLLIQFGFLQTPEQWHDLSDSQKVHYEQIITDDVVD